MSLKAFHIFFIVLSTTLAVGFGVYAIRDYAASKNIMTLWLGIASLIGGAVLIFYFFWFLEKIKRIDPS